MPSEKNILVRGGKVQLNQAFAYAQKGEANPVSSFRLNISADDVMGDITLGQEEGHVDDFVSVTALLSENPDGQDIVPAFDIESGFSNAGVRIHHVNGELYFTPMYEDQVIEFAKTLFGNGVAGYRLTSNRVVNPKFGGVITNTLGDQKDEPPSGATPSCD